MAINDTMRQGREFGSRRPLILLALAFITGIFIGEATGLSLGACLSLFFFPILGFIFLKISKKSLGYVLCLLFFSIGALGINTVALPHFPKNHIIHFATGTAQSITGQVIEITKKTEKRTLFTLAVETLEKDGVPFPAAGKIRMSHTNPGEKIVIGDRIRVSAKPTLIRNFQNPGHFNYQRFMAFQGIWVTASIKTANFSIISKGPSTFLQRIRVHIEKMIDRQPGTCDDKSVLKALIIGDRHSISPDVADTFNRAGAGHILAISGLHIGIIASVSLIFFKWVLSFSSFLLWRAWTHKMAAILSFFPVLGYGLISGMADSTERAVIMVGVFLFSLLSDREQDILNTLALAAILILLLRPQALYSISFQLSFMAVLSIILGLDALKGIKQGPDASVQRKIFRKFFLFFMVSFFAITGTLPLTLHHFNQTSTIGLFTNLFLVPLFGFIVTPMGLMAALLMSIFPLLSEILIQVILWLTHLGLIFIQMASRASFAAITTITPTPIFMICYYGIFFSSLKLVERFFNSAQKKNGEKSHHESIDKKIVWGVMLSSLILLILHIGFLFHKRFYADTLRLTAIDVGQGSATLVEFPHGKTMLVDGGGFSDNSIFDMGKNIIAPLLLKKQIKTIDIVLLTHPESDHLNGLLYILDHFTVNRFISTGETKETYGCRKLQRIIHERGIPNPNFAELNRAEDINGVTLQILHPFCHNEGVDSGMLSSSSNNNSIVLRIVFGAHSFLLPGDIMKMAEKNIVAAYGKNLKSSVLFVPHHGGATSSSPAFLRAISPKIAVISVGWRNRFRMPSKAVIKRLEAAGAKIYRTDINGAVELVTDGDALTLHPYIAGPSS